MAGTRRAGERPAVERALAWLARREYSAAELRARLVRGGYPGEEIDAALAMLRERGWQADGRYAASLARARVARGCGPRRIKAELEARGVEDGEIRAALGALEGDWLALALAELRRHGASRNLGDAVVRAKEGAFLLRRGFDPATVRAALRAALQDECSGSRN